MSTLFCGLELKLVLSLAPLLPTVFFAVDEEICAHSCK